MSSQVLRRLPVAPRTDAALLARLSALFAETAADHDRSGAFPRENFAALQAQGLVGWSRRRPRRRRRLARTGAPRAGGRGLGRAGDRADPHHDLAAAAWRSAAPTAAGRRICASACCATRCARRLDQRPARGAGAGLARARRPARDDGAARRRSMEARRPQALHHRHRGADAGCRCGAAPDEADAAHRRLPGAARRARHSRGGELGPPGPARLGQPRGDVRGGRDPARPCGRPARAGRMGARCRQPDRHRRPCHAAGLDGGAAGHALRRGGACRARLAASASSTGARRAASARRWPACRACRRHVGEIEALLRSNRVLLDDAAAEVDAGRAPSATDERPAEVHA